MIDKKTTLCISIAEFPGNFGAKIHNEAYRMLNLNFIYLPRKVLPCDLKAIMSSLRPLEIRGCSVSMPHKEAVIPYLDTLDLSAQKIGAVNTIVNNKGMLKGYNTDYYGAKKAIEEVTSLENKPVLLLGAGGVAKAIGIAIKELGANITVANRSFEKAKSLAEVLGAEYISLSPDMDYEGYMLINATSVGMRDRSKMIVSEDQITKYEIIQDVVMSPFETKLIKNAKNLNKRVISGLQMCKYQAAEQFKLYTGHTMPLDQMQHILKGV